MQNSATEDRLWLVGQYVSAAAALELLNQRATNSKSPWPEFAEYNCVSCHHNLADKRGHDDGFFAVAAGKPVWGTWHFSLLERLANTSEQFGSASFSLDIEKLRAELQSQMPDKNTIRPLTVGMREHCEQMADYLSQSTLSGQEAVELIAADTGRAAVSWDLLMQRYLAAVAFRQSLIDLQRMDGRYSASDFEQSKTALLEIRETLKFTEGYNGPQDLDAKQRNPLEQNFGKVLNSIKVDW